MTVAPNNDLTAVAFVAFDTHPEAREFRQWCRDNCIYSEPAYDTGDITHLLNETQTVLLKLRWHDNIRRLDEVMR